MKASKSIRTQKEFDLVYKKGKVFFGNLFTLRVLRAADLTDFKFGIVIANKTLPSAVDRNRKKRQMREIIKAQTDDFGGMWMSVILKESGAKASFQDLKKEFARVVRTALTKHK